MTTHEFDLMTDADFLCRMERAISAEMSLPTAAIERIRRLADWADTIMPARGYMVVDKRTGLKAIAAARARLPKEPEPAPQADEPFPESFVKAVDLAAKGIGQAVDGSLNRFIKAMQDTLPGRGEQLTNAEVEWVWHQAVEARANHGRNTPWPDMTTRLAMFRSASRG